MLRIGQHRQSTTCNFFLARPTSCCLLRSNTTQHNWTDSWVRGFRMLAAYQAVEIPRWSQIKSCQPTCKHLLQSRRLLEGAHSHQKLASAAKVTEQQAKDWLKKQAIWQVYLPAPRHIPRPKCYVAVPNEVHQADLLFLPHDRIRRKTFCYALTVVDVASRYKEAEPLTAAEVADGLARIYKRSPFRWPKLLQVVSSWAPSVSCWRGTLSTFCAVGLTSTGNKAS